MDLKVEKSIIYIMLTRLVQQGCRVILPDAHLHGERDEKLDEVEISLRFWEIVLTSIEEVGHIKAELEKRGYFTGQKIGIAWNVNGRYYYTRLFNSLSMD